MARIIGSVFRNLEGIMPNQLKRTSLLLAILFTRLTVGETSSRKRYDGFKVLRIEVPSRSAEKLGSILQEYELDYWRLPSRNLPSYDVMASSKIVDELLQAISNTSIRADVIIDDVQQLIDRERKSSENVRRKRNSQPFQYHRYHPLREIKRWMYLFARKNKDIVRIVQVGTSYQGRRILALKIGTPSINTSKRIIWQDGLIHGREWITGATLIWVCNELVEKYRGNDPETVNFLQQLDWYIVPVWNVDGYRHTWSKDRMWRKSRSEAGSFGCYGVDLNRNFNTPNRGEGTSSDNPCSEVYHGPFAFSELESLSVQQFMKTKRSLIVGVITLHSYAQFWLFPYGFTKDVSGDNEVLGRLSKNAVIAMHKKHGTVYKYGTVSELAYPVSGGSIDWSYRSLCVKYTFGVELRDTGQHGFLLPSSLIVPTAEEYFEGLKAIGRHIIEEPIESQTSEFCPDGIKHF